MVIDTSAVLAILQLEPEAELFATMIEESPVKLISSVSVLDAGIIVEARKGKAGAQELDALLGHARVTISAFDLQQADIARDAYRGFGKGAILPP